MPSEEAMSPALTIKAIDKGTKGKHIRFGSEFNHFIKKKGGLLHLTQSAIT